MNAAAILCGLLGAAVLLWVGWTGLQSILQGVMLRSVSRSSVLEAVGQGGALHGIVEVTRAFSFPRVSFTGGVGVLFRADLAAASPRP